MLVWVNVWGKALGARLGILGVALASCLGGCIDDFDNPEGYGESGSGGGTSVNGYDCADLCEDSQSCDGADADECRSQCDTIEELVRGSVCRNSFEGVLDCVSDLSNVCTQQDVCFNEINDFSNCISEHCFNYPEECPGF